MFKKKASMIGCHVVWAYTRQKKELYFGPARGEGNISGVGTGGVKKKVPGIAGATRGGRENKECVYYLGNGAGKERFRERGCKRLKTSFV